VEERPDDPRDVREGLLVLTLLSLVAGLFAGAVGACFRLALEAGDRWRMALVDWAQGAILPGAPAIVLVCAAAAAIAAYLVQRFSRYASGSGIPHVEAVVRDELPHASIGLLPVKFVGGWLAIGSGLALGREGPSVQMGACLGSLLGVRLDPDDRRTLLAAGAGAGLAVAFDAPTAGAIFVLEELLRRFDTRVAIGALAASASAIAVARLVLGDTPDFHVAAALPEGIGAGLPFAALGLLAGLAGVAYNATIRGALALADAATRVPPVGRAGAVGALIGVLALIAPGVVGGGDPLTQAALSGEALGAALPLVFAIRFLLGAMSYAAGTPGGLFAPLLVLGAQLGCACAWLAGVAGEPPVVAGYAMVGMAAFFAAVVRSPLTGMVLVTEMTDSLAGLLPMVIASAMAMLVATVLRDPPIYDSLRERLLRAEREADTTRSSRWTSSSLPL
jgi:CIC family chloride channel protein